MLYLMYVLLVLFVFGVLRNPDSIVSLFCFPVPFNVLLADGNKDFIFVEINHDTDYVVVYVCK
jgi:hypothetical protein